MIDPVVSSVPAGAVVADVRFYLDGRSGRAAYEGGHLPGAVFVDMERDLSAHGDGSEGRHPLPGPDAFARAMARLGIGDRSTVVAYDDAGGVMAARLVWMLRALGVDAALLDGGMLAYEGPLETAESARGEAEFTARPWPEHLLASIDDAAEPGDAVLIDARPGERFAGAPDDLDPRFGHIPGARSVPCRENIDGEGRFAPVQTLRERFAEAGISEGSPVISYCGSGISACHNLLALEHAGLGAGRLFPGSWSQWSRDADRPVEV